MNSNKNLETLEKKEYMKEKHLERGHKKKIGLWWHKLLRVLGDKF